MLQNKANGTLAMNLFGHLEKQVELKSLLGLSNTSQLVENKTRIGIWRQWHNVCTWQQRHPIQMVAGLQGGNNERSTGTQCVLQAFSPSKTRTIGQNRHTTGKFLLELFDHQPASFCAGFPMDLFK